MTAALRADELGVLCLAIGGGRNVGIVNGNVHVTYVIRSGGPGNLTLNDVTFTRTLKEGWVKEAVLEQARFLRKIP